MPNEILESSSAKSVKRVRFSDEAQDVYEYEKYDVDIGTVSLDTTNNESCVKLAVEQSELYAEELIKYLFTEEVMKNNRNSDEDDKCGSDSRANKIDELSAYSDDINETSMINQQSNHSSVNETIGSSSAIDSVSDTLNQLIKHTELMSISSTETDLLQNQCFSLGELSFCISSGESPEKNILQETDQKCSPASRKRSLEEMQIEKQTSRVNSCLRRNNSFEIKSADEIRAAVFNAWSQVKNEKSPVQNSIQAPEIKKIHPFQKTSSEIIPDSLKRKTKKVKKRNLKISEPVSQKTEDDLEESKMAFRAWKKKKDELLNHQITEKYQKEEKERVDSLMNERMRKSDAETAFLAWNAHKAVVIKMERKKNRWLLEKEKEKLREKIKKDDKAAKVYYEWLRNKVYSTKTNNCTIIESKPPWTPPGKSNSLI